MKGVTFEIDGITFSFTPEEVAQIDAEIAEWENEQEEIDQLEPLDIL
jgi:hypothetical protein